MYLIRLIPISRGITKDELTYYSAVAYPEGSMVRVELRSRTVPALVVACTPVVSAKSDVRTARFALKKIRKQKSVQLLSPAFLRAAERTALEHAATVGAVVFSLLPHNLVGETPKVQTVRTPVTSTTLIPRVFQAPYEKRVEYYRTLVRESFAKGESALVLCPTLIEVERLHRFLAHGLGEHAVSITGSLSELELRTCWNHALTSDHPVLVVGTPLALALARADLKMFIVEREASTQYRLRGRPFLDTRIMAHELALSVGGTLTLGDLPLRIESIERCKRGEYEEIKTGHQRTDFATTATLIRIGKSEAQERTPFQAIGLELRQRLHETLAADGRAFLYAARRGLSPVTVCRDCGLTVACNECGASVVLHKGKEENHFLCHACGALRHARERCAACRSWRLEALGIGTELVERELTSLFPEARIQVLSSDTAKKHAQARAIAQRFMEAPRALLVGTELAVPYLEPHSSPLVAVVSLDSLLSIPSWSMYERIAATLTRLRTIASRELVVQTRREEADVLRTILSGNFSAFYKSELAMRKQFGYPPESVIVKISAEGSPEEVVRRMECAREMLLPHELVTFSRVLKGTKGSLLHGFLRLSKDAWPNPELGAQLRALPPSLTVQVNPESIL